MLRENLIVIRYDLPSVYTCNIKTSLLKYKLKWSCNFLLLRALISIKGSEALPTQHQLPTLCQYFQFFIAKLRLFWKSSDVLLQWTVRSLEPYFLWIHYHSSWTKRSKTRKYGSEKKVFFSICWQWQAWGGLNRKQQTPSRKIEKIREKLTIPIEKSKILEK